MYARSIPYEAAAVRNRTSSLAPDGGLHYHDQVARGKESSRIPSERLEHYDRLIATQPGVERKGATLPYTSVNGHMFSFLSDAGTLALRLPREDREAFLEQYGTTLHEAHGTVMKEVRGRPRRPSPRHEAARSLVQGELCLRLRPEAETSPSDALRMVGRPGRSEDTMDRQTWLRERRAAVEAEYDLDAPAYDDDQYPTGSHDAFVMRLLDTCPADGTVLDAPCGTGKYFELVRASGRRVVGIDQSAGMLGQAEARGIATRLEHIGLQELAFDAEFDAAMTIDAMENIPPEDWPVVLANLHRAVRPGGHLYLTVEEKDDETIDTAFAASQATGLPAVRGEVLEGDTAGYHYYPGRHQVVRWLAAEGLEVLAEAFDQEVDWGYRHLLVRTRP